MTRAILLMLFSLLMLGPFSFAQKVVKGVIRDQEGTPAVGATVLVLGTQYFAVADTNGQFTLSIGQDQPLPVTLRFSSVGLEPFDQKLEVISAEILQINLLYNNNLAEVIITSRRRTESAQEVPIPISVVGGKLVADAGAFNVNRLKELVPSVQLYSSNPRNTTLNIRGLGSTFGLTNDGIDPGVGFYVDGVYYARPAATALDFIDVQQIEVLRGPQGTLFGKNTTAGAFNITTHAPSFKPEALLEVSYGNFGYIQAKTSLSGPLGKKLAGRLSFSGTQRDGLIYNIRTEKYINDLNNLGLRGQLLYQISPLVKLTLAGDFSSQNPDGYAQVVAGVVPTKRAAYRQFSQIIADLEYSLPTENPFDRIVDHDSPWRSGNDLGGASLNLEANLGEGKLTATSAWRFWHWDPSNDRDFTGLPVLTRSAATSRHAQWTQEVRYAGDLTSHLSGVIGAFFIAQDLNTDPAHVEESGAAQWRFSQSSTSPLWRTPGLLDGYGIRTVSRLQTLGAALFAQADWAITKQLHLLPGLRFNFDQKEVNYDRKTYGGLATTDPALLALKRAVYTDQAFDLSVDEQNWSGQLTLAYKPSKRYNAFATYSTSYKPVGVNLGGLPTANGATLIELARIKPEFVTHWELGFKSSPTLNSTFNLVFHNTMVKDFQTQVQTAEVGVNRGYLANAEKIRVYGVEIDANLRLGKAWSWYGALAYTEGKYVTFTNAPVPLEETGSSQAFKDISGERLPGISKWAGTLGGELALNGKFAGQGGQFFLALESYYRSEFSSSPSPSQYLNIQGYALVNTRIGFRADNGFTLFAWVRNMLDQDYFEQLLPAAGNAGHYAGVLGDPRTYGMTLRYSFR